MRVFKILVLVPVLLIGASAFDDPATTSFTGSCVLHSTLVTHGHQLLASFDVKVDATNLYVTQVIGFTAPNENNVNTNFVVRAMVNRPDTGDGTGLKISSPDHTNESWVSDAKPGTVLLTRYYIRTGRIDCQGRLK